ncbi:MULTISPECIES: cache domain-containing sensor histidine kinase [Paenibacillus]|uniref:Two-component sensor histidine kinase n=2 Tax=Paenibacillus TaxID=44249 RepID=A0ABX2ZHN4_PAEPO|nr:MULTISPECIES: histidine kinase [Paenibacillus]APB76028.1 HAMP domain-containing protein [Paenibacillus polymyxa]APQ59438.1 histidine kinase [Paenibacillus polymyxa]MCP3747634.1 histidine kinase [Paenibacillus sp. A3M_27_13]MDR6775764.1 two-component system sensor histidine kinase YesM [Paenibacillus peoriae]ODA11263.1 two-component sensor histidine kinase [Paenibacillus polymyxa]
MNILSLARKWFGRLRFKSKVITVFLPLIIVSLLTLGLLSNQLFSRSLIDRTTSNVVDESQLILSRTDYIFSSVETAANIMVTNINRMYDSYGAKPGTAMESIQFGNLMQSRLSIDLSIFREVDAAVFIDNEGTIFASYTESGDDRKIYSMLKRVRESESYGQALWFDMEKRDFLTPDPNSPVLTLGKTVINIDTGEPYGTLFLLVKEEGLADYFRSSDPDAPKSYYFLDNGMRVAVAEDNEMLMNPVNPQLGEAIQRCAPNASQGTCSFEDEGNLVTVTDYTRMDWKLVNIVSLSLLTADVRQNVRLSLLIGILCLVFSWLGASFLSKMVVSPLEHLTRAMRKVVTGDLQAVTTVRTEDEIGTIAEAFNFMVRRVRELLDEVRQEQNRKREYELALISAQIKPHFLYNTLDTIYALNELDRNDEARDTTKALADFYRMVLNKGRELITLEKEAQITDDYLTILQIRYPDVFRYEVDIPAELAGTPIPKLSLQPLVENSIYHGLKKKGTKGFIRIFAFKQGDKVIVRVEDNGVGMDEFQVQTIMSRHLPKEGIRSIGTYSVQQRLSLYFGEEYGISVQSILAEGTTVDLSLPMLPKGSEHQDV